MWGILGHKTDLALRNHHVPGRVRASVRLLPGNRGGAIMGSKWSVAAPGGSGAYSVATLQGRGGMIGALSGLSTRPQQEEGAAIGSQLSFTATPNGSGRTVYTMALTQVAMIYLFFTADARFFCAAHEPSGPPAA